MTYKFTFIIFVLIIKQLKKNGKMEALKMKATKVEIKVTANGVTFLNFFNMTECYFTKSFQTEKIARNYAIRFDYQVFEKMPEHIKFNLY